eukprot:3435739-Alexandrium_andersonii.AAC.1
MGNRNSCGARADTMRCAREHFGASEPARASDNASSLRTPCPALACRTPSNTRPARAATPS